MAKTHWQPIPVFCSKCRKEMVITTVAINLANGDFLFEGTCVQCGVQEGLMRTLWEIIHEAVDCKVLLHMWGEK